MKLYDGGKIIAGIVVFLILASGPFWYERGKVAAIRKIKIPAMIFTRS